MPEQLRAPYWFIDYVRKRPGMYVGDIGDFGLSHLVYEVLDMTVGDSRRSPPAELQIRMPTDDLIEITDDGSAISPSAFDGNWEHSEGNPLVPFEVEWRVVAALSERLEVTSWSPDAYWQVTTKQGRPVERLTVREEMATRQGLRVRMWPDRTLLSKAGRFDVSRIFARSRDIAAFMPGLRVSVVDESTGAEQVRRLKWTPFSGPHAKQ